MWIDNDKKMKAAGAELARLFEIVEHPTSDEENKGVRERIREIEAALKVYDNSKKEASE